MGESITLAQLRKIWARSRETGLDKEQLRDVVEGVCGDRSLRALSKSQATLVIDRLENKPQPIRKRRFPGVTALPEGVQGMPAAGHLSLIRELQVELGWDEERLNAWLWKYFRVHNIRGLDWHKARGAFLGLRAIKQRRPKSREKNRGGK